MAIFNSYVSVPEGILSLIVFKSMAISGTDWRYLAYMFGLFFRPKFQGRSPQKMANNMVLTYLHVF